VNPLNILFVDDEQDFLATLLKRIKKRGINALGAGSGQEALLRLQEQSFDAVVLDVKMPGMDGIETLRQIKKQRPLVEVIMLTGHADVEVAVTGMELGAFDYLMKPMDIDELMYKLEDAHKKKLIQEKKIRAMEKMAGGQ